MKRMLIKRVAFAIVCVGLAAFAAANSAAAANTTLKAVGQQVENLVDPVGVGVANPRLSWHSCPVSDSDVYNKSQTAYQILVSSSPEALKADVGDLWDSGKTVSDQSLYIEYSGKPLTTFQHCYWKDRV